MMIDGRDELPEALDRYNQGKRQYNAAVASWSRRLPEGDIRELLLGTADEANRNYMDTVENRVIPALQKGDRKAVLDEEAKLTAFSDRNIAAREEAIRLAHARQPICCGSAPARSSPSASTRTSTGFPLRRTTCRRARPATT
jgi:hypothetical protein